MEDFWVFVYGTLKRGQLRDQCWPVRPIEIADAWMRGSLYTGPSYPAMRDGGDRVRGEAWRFAGFHREIVIEVLDEIEGTYADDRANLYDRKVLPVFLLNTDEQSVDASVYLYAIDPAIDGFSLLEPDEDSWVSWPPK